MKPHVVVYVTATVDGRIASRTGYSRLSCRYDLERLHKARALSDAVMVGANTVVVDDPSLTVRYVEGKNPARIVVDGALRIPSTAKILRDGAAETIIVTSEWGASRRNTRELTRQGHVSVLVFPGGPVLDMGEVLEALGELGYKRILVEGGGTLLWSLFSRRLVDELRITWAPYIFGGRDAVPMVSGKGFDSTRDAVKLELIHLEKCRCGNEIHAVYRIAG